MWVLIDNYDSFTHILHHYLVMAGGDCAIYRNDAITINELEALHPSRIILSPGPETPAQAGITMEVIAAFHNRLPILGVCLGHQALGMYYGAELKRLSYPMHGKQSPVRHEGHPLFAGLGDVMQVGRYHSLHIDAAQATELAPLATAMDDGTLMAMKHEAYPSVGIQFHPESILTDGGLRMIENWASMY